MVHLLRYYTSVLCFLVLIFSAVSIFSQPVFQFRFGSVGTSQGEFDEPGGLVIGPDESIYVVDRTNHRIQIFTLEGDFLEDFGTFGSRLGEFFRPVDIAFLPENGDLYVVEREGDRVQVFDSNLNPKFTFGVKGNGAGEFESPTGIAIDKSGNVFVCDRNNHRIQRFTQDGEYVSEFGTIGTGFGEFITPHDVAIAPSGDLFVTDRGNNRIQVFTNTGAFQYAFGSLGDDEGEFDSPLRMVFAGNGEVLITDFENDRIQRFLVDGTFVQSFGVPGALDNQFDGPTGIAIADGILFVSEANNNRVQVFFDETLPVEWLSFEAFAHSDHVQLNWSTSQEVNNDFFEVQRSNAAVLNWETVGVISGIGNTNNISTYSFSDVHTDQMNKKVLYRIKQVDIDGQFSYSNIVEVSLKVEENQFWIHYDSNQEQLTYQFNHPSLSDEKLISLRLLHMNGAELMHRKIRGKNGGITESISTRNFPSGIYVAIIDSETNPVYQKVRVE